jgi:hypothetical protein
MTETTHADRTDSCEEKLRLLEAAWKCRDLAIQPEFRSCPLRRQL